MFTERPDAGILLVQGSRITKGDTFQCTPRWPNGRVVEKEITVKILPPKKSLGKSLSLYAIRTKLEETAQRRQIRAQNLEKGVEKKALKALKKQHQEERRLAVARKISESRGESSRTGEARQGGEEYVRRNPRPAGVSNMRGRVGQVAYRECSGQSVSSEQAGV